MYTVVSRLQVSTLLAARHSSHNSLVYFLSCWLAFGALEHHLNVKRLRHPRGALWTRMSSISDPLICYRHDWGSASLILQGRHLKNKIYHSDPAAEPMACMTMNIPCPGKSASCIPLFEINVLKCPALPFILPQCIPHALDLPQRILKYKRCMFLTWDWAGFTKLLCQESIQSLSTSWNNNKRLTH